MDLLRRIAPAVTLVVLAPLVGEFLLGDVTVAQLYVVVPFALLYGCGALLVREVARRLGGGWWSILLLALAYGILEEGVVTMSLVDPDYLGLHLLAYGWIPSVGTSPVWTVYVLTLHTVWSIGVPIAVVEGIAGARAREPWLRIPGTVVTAVLFVVGILISGVPQVLSSGFIATPVQLACVAAGILVAVLAAVLLARRGVAERPGGYCPVVLPAAIGLAGGLAFQGLSHLWSVLAPAVALLGMLVLETGLAIGIAIGSARHRPGPRGPAAIALGALVAYGVWGVVRVASGGSLAGDAGAVPVAGQVVLVVVLTGVAMLGVVRARRFSGGTAPTDRVPVEAARSV